MYSSNEIKSLFLKFFYDNNHYIFDSSPLIPNKYDNSILFTNSGINQFKNIVIGNSYPVYKNIVTSQKCIRIGGKNNDLENVGYTSKHNTYFEMLGNFSFNNYFKEESIELAFKFITNKNLLNISKNKLIITINFSDELSYNIWKKLGINDNRIVKIGNNNILNSDNFWIIDDIGPCGSSTEIFFIKDINFKSNENIKNILDNKCIEIWNIVFMEFYYKNKKLYNLPYNSIDTGMGLERITSIIQNVNSNYKIDIFVKIINIIKNELFNLNKNIKLNKVFLRIVSDHIRSIIYIYNENILPSNYGRGYILKKLIRRSLSYGYLINVKKPFLYKIINILLKNIKIDNISINNFKNIEKIIFNEEILFFKNINKCISILNNEINKCINLNISFIFKLYDTYGLPLVIIKKYLRDKNIKFDIKQFNNLLNIQKFKSKLNKKFSL